jgi:hypothetical protein
MIPPQRHGESERPRLLTEGGQPTGRPPGIVPERPRRTLIAPASSATLSAVASEPEDALAALRPHRWQKTEPVTVPPGNIEAIAVSTLPVHSSVPPPRQPRPTARTPSDHALIRDPDTPRCPPFQPTWTLHPLLWAQLLSIQPSTLEHPPIDWFASANAHVSRRFKHAGDSAWDYVWSPANWSILLCPLCSATTCEVIEKCTRDGTRATIIAAVRPSEPWYASLAERAYVTATIPRVLGSCLAIHDGRPVPQVELRAFFIDPSRPPSSDGPTAVFLTLPRHWRTLYRSTRSCLRLELWQQLLQHHPDDAFVTRFLDTARFGAVTNYKGPRLLPRSCENPSSQHTRELCRLRAVEASKNWRSGAFPAEDPPLFNLLCNPTKGVAKRGSAKVRHCVNMTAPYDGTSVNALTDRIRTIEHTKFDEVATCIDHLGPNALLIKVDVVSAYKLIWLALQELHLHGEMEDVDGCSLVSFSNVLNFGGTTSADIFEDLGEALEFVLRLLLFAPPHVLARYADDFIGAIAPRDGLQDYPTAHRLFGELKRIATILGVPLAKFEGPAPSLVFLGTGIDAPRGIAFLTEERKRWALEDLNLWSHASSGSQKALLSLAGTLDNIARVIPWGRAFIARIRKAAYSVRSLHHIAHLGRDFKDEICWWKHTIPVTHSRPLCVRDWSPHDAPVMDASPTGFGAYFNGAWLYGVWPQETLLAAFRTATIATGFLELLIVAITAATWGPLWTGRRVLVITDNSSAESAINSRFTPNSHMQPLLRAIGTLASQHGFDVRAQHIDTKLNVIADPLSRSKTMPDWFHRFSQAAPNAQSSPTTPSPVPGLPFKHV